MENGKILICSPSGEPKWVDVRGYECAFQDGTLIVKKRLGAEPVVKCKAIPTKKNMIGSVKNSPITTMAYKTYYGIYAAGKYLKDIYEDITKPDYAASNTITIFFDKKEELGVLFDENIMKKLTSIKNTIVVYAEDFKTPCFKINGETKKFYADNKIGEKYLSKFISYAPDNSVKLNYIPDDKTIFNNNDFVKKIEDINIPSDVTLTTLMKENEVFTHKYDNIVIDGSNKVIYLFDLTDNSKEDAKYIANQMNTTYKDWTLYILSKDGLYVLSPSKDFSKLSSRVIIDFILKENKGKIGYCGVNIQYTYKSIVDIRDLPMKVAIDLLKYLHSKKINAIIGDGIATNNTKEDFKSHLIIVDDNKFANLIKDKIQDEYSKVTVCKSKLSTDIKDKLNYQARTDLEHFSSDLGGIDGLNNKLSGKDKKEKLSIRIVGIDLTSSDDISLLQKYIKDDNYSIVQVENVWRNRLNQRMEKTCITINKEKNEIIIGDNEINAPRVFASNNDKSFNVNQAYAIFTLFPHYKYIVKSTIKVNLTKNTDFGFNVLHFAFINGFLNKMDVFTPFRNVSNGTISNPYVFDWKKIEQEYSKDFAYAVLDNFFNEDDKELMLRYITEYNCFQFETPDMYSWFKKKYAKYQQEAAENFGKCQKAANYLSSITDMPIMSNFGAYIYNEAFNNPSTTVSINEYTVYATNCQQFDELNFNTLVSFGYNLSKDEMYAEGLEYQAVIKGKTKRHISRPNKYDFKIYPEKDPITFETYEYDKTGNPTNIKKYSVTNYSFTPSEIDLGDNVYLRMLPIDTYEVTSKPNSESDCPNLDFKKADKPSYQVVSYGFNPKFSYCYDGVCSGSDVDEEYRFIFSVEVSGGDYKTSSMKVTKLDKDDNDKAIFEVLSVKEDEEGWTEVRLIPKVKLKGKKEKVASLVSVDDMIIPKGEL